MYMLNTNICIYVLRKRPDRLRLKFNEVRNLCISSVTYAELCFGISSGSPALRRERWGQLDAFTRLLLIEALDVEVGKHYGSLRALMREQDMPIGNNDLLIASHARSIGAVLVTNNIREFSRIPDLTVENWL
jgi:tRNA(fMet)-specific endonuclease VapC